MARTRLILASLMIAALSACSNGMVEEGGPSVSSATHERGPGCHRVENGPVLKAAQKLMGGDVNLMTHCTLLPRGIAASRRWNSTNRYKYGVASVWRELNDFGFPASGVPTETGLLFEKLKVKRGQEIPILILISAKDLMFKRLVATVTEDGIVRIPADKLRKLSGKDVFAFPHGIVGEESTLKWHVYGVPVCYPSGGDDNYTRDSYFDGNGNYHPSELFRMFEKKRYGVIFTITCGGEPVRTSMNDNEATGEGDGRYLRPHPHLFIVK